MKNADKFSWKVLLEKGHVTTGWSFYGCGFNNDRKATEKAHREIKQVGIDWKKTQPVYEDTEQSFAGTFADACDFTTVIAGTLVLNNGNRYTWGADDISIHDISKILIETLADKIEIDI
jgi:hypothetical protein